MCNHADLGFRPERKTQQITSLFGALPFCKGFEGPCQHLPDLGASMLVLLCSILDARFTPSCMGNVSAFMFSFSPAPPDLEPC